MSENINFIAGGMMGDFIHSLYVVKNICEKRGCKANLYLTDSGDKWKKGLLTAHADLEALVMAQPYINRFRTGFGDLNEAQCYNLNNWRQAVATTHSTTGKYDKCWSEVLSQYYGFEIPKEHAWLEPKMKVSDGLKETNYVVIHRSKHHHNSAFPWENIIHSIQKQIVFLTSDISEWEAFPFKNDKIDVSVVQSIQDMVTVMEPCRFFIGNQSAPFALASALDVPRLCELDHDPAPFYIGEEKYSKNISWWLNPQTKHFSENAFVRI